MCRPASCQLLVLLPFMLCVGISLSMVPPEHGQASQKSPGGAITSSSGRSPSGSLGRTSPSGQGYEQLFASNNKIWTNHSIQFDRALPSWLQGSHFHVGPGLFEMGTRKVMHVFDGFAKVNKFHFADQRAWYSNQFIASGYFQDSIQQQSIAPYMLFGEVKPPFSFWEHFLKFANGLDNMNVNIKLIGDQLVTLTDIWPYYVIDPTSLKTIKKVSPSESSESLLPLLSSSHPVKAANSSDHITFACIMDPIPFTKSFIDVIRMTSASDRTVITRIERDWNHLPAMHSLAVSPNYAVIFAHPCFIRELKPLVTDSFLDALTWRPDLPTDVYVVKLSDGEITKLQTGPLFFLHHVNSYEEDNRIIIDYTVGSGPDLYYLYKMDIQLNRTARDASHYKTYIKRFTIDMESKTISVTDFSSTAGAEAANRLDMPKINDKLAHKKHCYVFGMTFRADNITFADYVLSKKDVCHSQNDQVWSATNHYPLEPFFVPRPGATQEDDGLLMSVILDGQLKKSYIGAFDAQTMKLISRGYLPDVVPLLIHGHFLPTKN